MLRKKKGHTALLLRLELVKSRIHSFFCYPQRSASRPKKQAAKLRRRVRVLCELAAEALDGGVLQM